MYHFKDSTWPNSKLRFIWVFFSPQKLSLCVFYFFFLMLQRRPSIRKCPCSGAAWILQLLPSATSEPQTEAQRVPAAPHSPSGSFPWQQSRHKHTNSLQAHSKLSGVWQTSGYRKWTHGQILFNSIANDNFNTPRPPQLIPKDLLAPDSQISRNHCNRWDSFSHIRYLFGWNLLGSW